MADVCVIGSYVQDLAFSTPTFPAPGETRIGTFQTGPGGKGFNQAVACNRQGVSTTFIGAVGDDIFGRGVRDFIASEGLTAHLQKFKEYASGAASIVVNASAENLIVVALGANDHLSPDYIADHEESIKGAKVVVCQVENNIAATEKALFLAGESNAVALLNPAPINDKLSQELVLMSDVLVPNETEFAFLMEHLFGVKLPDDYWNEDDATLHGYCCQAEVEVVILTLGDKGCFVSYNENARRVRGDMRPEQDFFRVPVVKVSPRDTTGAGDAFSGGLAAGLVRFNLDLKKSLEYATVVAGLSTEKAGTAPAMPTREEVEARL
ncbi:MAG: ribokinase [Gammaproteobacteria bacterium]|nr:ribokinase [Gammaproteobacteria bacterium]